MGKNRDKKLQIILTILIVLIVTTLIVIFVSKTRPTSNNDYEVIIDNEGNSDDVIYNDFKITDVSFETDRVNNNSKIYLTIRNDSDTDKYMNSFNIIVKDNTGNKINKFYVMVDKQFAPGEEYNTVTGGDIILEDAYKLEFEFN